MPFAAQFAAVQHMKKGDMPFHESCYNITCHNSRIRFSYHGVKRSYKFGQLQIIQHSQYVWCFASHKKSCKLKERYNGCSLSNYLY